jgi:hypothetical protein
MIIPKKEGHCDDQNQNLPCCENVMGIYPSIRRRRRRRRRCSPWMIPRRGLPEQVVEVPFPVPSVTYLDPLHVPDMVLPPMPPPPPRRPRSMMYNGHMPISPSWMHRRRPQCTITRECNSLPVGNYCNCGNC